MEQNKKKVFVLLKQRRVTNDYCPRLTEEDFYPPSDNRTWKSNIKDIEGGDNFGDYCSEFFKMLNEEEYYDN